MSQQEHDTLIADLVRDHATTQQELERVENEINHLAERFSHLAGSLRVKEHTLVNPSYTNGILRELPNDLSPSVIRALMARQTELAAKLAAIRGQLKPYGLGE